MDNDKAVSEWHAIAMELAHTMQRKYRNAMQWLALDATDKVNVASLAAQKDYQDARDALAAHLRTHPSKVATPGAGEAAEVLRELVACDELRKRITKMIQTLHSGGVPKDLQSRAISERLDLEAEHKKRADAAWDRARSISEGVSGGDAVDARRVESGGSERGAG